MLQGPCWALILTLFVIAFQIGLSTMIIDFNVDRAIISTFMCDQ